MKTMREGAKALFLLAFVPLGGDETVVMADKTFLCTLILAFCTVQQLKSTVLSALHALHKVLYALSDAYS